MLSACSAFQTRCLRSQPHLSRKALIAYWPPARLDFASPNTRPPLTSVRPKNSWKAATWALQLGCRAAMTTSEAWGSPNASGGKPPFPTWRLSNLSDCESLLTKAPTSQRTPRRWVEAYCLASQHTPPPQFQEFPKTKPVGTGQSRRPESGWGRRADDDNWRPCKVLSSAIGASGTSSLTAACLFAKVASILFS